MPYLGSQSHGSRGQKVTVRNLCSQEAELGLVDEAEQVFALLLESGILKVLLDVRVGILGAGVRVAEARHVDRCGGEYALSGGGNW
jgi:hypothetical protein